MRADSNSIEECLREVTASLMHPDFRETYINSENWQETAVSETFYNSDADYPLTSHDGYTFGKWIDSSSSAYTAYGDAVKTNNIGAIEQIPVPDSPNYSDMDMTRGIALKAAYVANARMNALTTASARNYTLSLDTSPGSGCFERCGASSYYSVKVKIERKNSNGNGVHRPRAMALRVSYSIDGKLQYSLIKLKNSDTQIAEIILPNTMLAVSCDVIDIVGNANWVSGCVSRNNDFSFDAGAVRHQDYTGVNDIGFVFLGATYTANKVVAENLVTGNQFNAYIANLCNIARDVIYWGDETPVNTAAVRMERVMTNIRVGQAKKLADFIAANPGVTPSVTDKYLSYEELRSAVYLGGENYLTPVPADYGQTQTTETQSNNTEV